MSDEGTCSDLPGMEFVASTRVLTYSLDGNHPFERQVQMAWIRMIDEDRADDALKTYYKKYGDPFSGVDNILKIHSLNPDSLRYHYELYKHLMTGKSELSRMQREMIGTVVSRINACRY